MALTSSQLTTFDQFKILINRLRDKEQSDFLTRIVSVSLTGFVASAAALPFDNIKMKLMKMSPDKNGKMPYKGVVDCAMKSIKREGFKGLWVGYMGFWSLVAPHTMVTLMTMDYLHFFFGSKVM
jgi:solute carrier family 25 oxoglutarate transporter 11